jgi:DNA-binding transcriptional regulator YhcF (GntR family)
LDGDSPIFQQVKAALEEEILDGALGPGQQVPSNRQLVALWAVNPLTVMKGVGLLVEEGVLYKKRGEGIFVSEDAPERLRRRLGESFYTERLEPLVRLAAILGISPAQLHRQIDVLWEGFQHD